MYQKRTETKFANLKIFFSFHLYFFSVGRLFKIASPAVKKVEVYIKSKVRGFDGTSEKFHVIFLGHHRKKKKTYPKFSNSVSDRALKNTQTSTECTRPLSLRPSRCRGTKVLSGVTRVVVVHVLLRLNHVAQQCWQLFQGFEGIAIFSQVILPPARVNTK